MTGASLAHNNRLAVLAADIRIAHGDIERGALALAERALAAGAALNEAKLAVPHGAWATWLRENTGLSGRTARRYMQLAESGLKLATVAELGLRAATEAIGRRCSDPDAMSVDPAFRQWAIELFDLLAKAERASPGFKAVFRHWAEGQEQAKQYGERLLFDCKSELQRARLQKLIDVQERDSFDDLCDMMRSQVMQDHAAVPVTA